MGDAVGIANCERGHLSGVSVSFVWLLEDLEQRKHKNYRWINNGQDRGGAVNDTLRVVDRFEEQKIENNHIRTCNHRYQQHCPIVRARLDDPCPYKSPSHMESLP